MWDSPEKKRILFVLKEAYGDDWGDYTLTTWLGDKHPHHKMWMRVARMTHGIQNTDANRMERYKPELTEEEHCAALDQIAVMNLKKSHGEPQSKYDEIRMYAVADREEIKKEFELIDADIVVCGSTFKTLYENVYEQEPLRGEKASDNWYYYINLGGRERLFIDFYHPANHWPDLMNYYGLVGIYQQALMRR